MIIVANKQINDLFRMILNSNLNFCFITNCKSEKNSRTRNQIDYVQPIRVSFRSDAGGKGNTEKSEPGTG